MPNAKTGSATVSVAAAGSAAMAASVRVGMHVVKVNGVPLPLGPHVADAGHEKIKAAGASGGAVLLEVTTFVPAVSPLKDMEVGMVSATHS